MVELLVAMVWGIGFYAGFVDSDDSMATIAKQRHRLFARTWPGLALVIDVPAGQPFIRANGAQPLAVSGDFTGERVRSALYRAYRVESFVEGIGRDDTLDAVA
jgi:hypothetical protein